MISQQQVDEVRDLLDAKRFSQRQIAKITGLSRGTIGAIASGKRHDRPEDPLGPWDAPLGPIIRCPGCGGTVFAPCRLCFIRTLKKAERNQRRTVDRTLDPTRDATGYRTNNRIRNAPPG